MVKVKRTSSENVYILFMPKVFTAPITVSLISWLSGRILFLFHFHNQQRTFHVGFYVYSKKAFAKK